MNKNSFMRIINFYNYISCDYIFLLRYIKIPNNEKNKNYNINKFQ